MVMCLDQGADLHMAQLMPLPLTISCSSKSRLVLPSWLCVLSFWCQLTWIVPEKIEDGCKMVVCVCVCVKDVSNIICSGVTIWCLTSYKYENITNEGLEFVDFKIFKLIKYFLITERQIVTWKCQTSMGSSLNSSSDFRVNTPEK